MEERSPGRHRWKMWQERKILLTGNGKATGGS